MSSSVSLCIVGNIGAGKTTLINHLKDVLDNDKVEVVLEPIEIWEANGTLTTFYEDMEKNAFWFQLTVFNDYVDEVLKSVAKAPDVTIIERSMYCQKLFWSTHTKTEKEDITYLNMWNKWRRLIPTPTHYVFLETNDVDELHSRIRKRDRGGESSITKVYTQTLIDKHSELYTHDNFDNLLILDALDSVENNVYKVVEFLK